MYQNQEEKNLQVPMSQSFSKLNKSRFFFGFDQYMKITLK